MRTLISSLESDSKRSTLESSSTSSSSRIVECSSLICANPLCFLLKLFSQASHRESFVAGREWGWVASPGLEGGQVAVLPLYARSDCIILLYRGWAHHSNELFITTFFANFDEGPFHAVVCECRLVPRLVQLVQGRAKERK